MYAFVCLFHCVCNSKLDRLFLLAFVYAISLFAFWLICLFICKSSSVVLSVFRRVSREMYQFETSRQTYQQKSLISYGVICMLR